MRRRLAVLVIVVMLAPMVTSCGGGGGAWTPPPPPPVGTATEVLHALATASDPPAMRTAISEVTYKTALGYSTAGGSYAYYPLSRDQVSDLADVQLSSHDPDGWITLAETFRQFQLHSQHPLGVAFEAVLPVLQAAVNDAYTSIEVPDHSLLVMMTARGVVPSSAPIVSGSSQVSPLQGLLFYAWLIERYRLTSGRDARQDCLNACMRTYQWDVAIVTAGYLFLAALALFLAGLSIATLPANWPAWLALLAAANAAEGLARYLMSLWSDYESRLDELGRNYHGNLAKCPTGGGGKSPERRLGNAPCCTGTPSRA